MEFDQFKLFQEHLFNNIYSQQIQQNEENIKTWIQYRDSHKKIIEGLEVLSRELSINCMVPIGKRALIKGTLKHTSEILVCIGDGYFVKYTTQQAIALCNRRIKRSEEILEQFEKERNLLEMRQILPINQGAFETDDCKNVIEHWDEKKLENWRVEHRKKEQEYRKQLIKLKDLKKQEIVTESDLFKRLDELELEEELADELNRFEDQNKFYYQDSQENNTDEELEDEESVEESEESEEESEEGSDKKVKEVSSKSILVNQNEHAHNKTDILLRPDEQLTDLNQSQFQNNEEVACALKIEKIDDVNKTVKLLNKNREEPSIKDTKINGKFEVSIIKEDEVEKTLGKRNYPVAFTPQKQKIKKNMQTCYNDYKEDYKESDNHFEKAKGSGRRVSFAEPNFIELESTPYSEINETCSEEELNMENENDEIIKISFTHSNIKPSIPENTENLITNPADIYRIFSKPKSILKKSPDIEHRKILLVKDDLEEYNTASDSIVKSTYNIVVQDVQERKAEKIVKESNISDNLGQNKQKSRFKLERANIKRAYK